MRGTVASALGSGLLALCLVAHAAGGTPTSTTETPSPTSVRAVLTGICTYVNRYDVNHVVTSSMLNCQATGPCSCEGATRISYDTSTRSPGTGAPGSEIGTIDVIGPGSSIVLTLKGTRTGLGLSTGTWTLGAVSGRSASALATSGSYTTRTRTIRPIPFTTSSAVQIVATVGCWACSPTPGSVQHT